MNPTFLAKRRAQRILLASTALFLMVKYRLQLLGLKDTLYGSHGRLEHSKGISVLAIRGPHLLKSSEVCVCNVRDLHTETAQRRFLVQNACLVHRTS